MPGRPALDQVAYAEARTEIVGRLTKLGIQPGTAHEEARDLMTWFVNNGWRQVRPPVLELPPDGTNVPVDAAPTAYTEARERLRTSHRTDLEEHVQENH